MTISCNNFLNLLIAEPLKLLTMSKSLIIVSLLALIFVSLSGCFKDEPNGGGIGPIEDGDYYVAINGDDNNPGTYDQPWATWQKAFETAKAGDIVYFRGGVYKPKVAAYGNNITMISPKGSQRIGNDGTYKNPICYFNYPGETPVLDCSLIRPAGNFNTGLVIDYADFLHFRGLTVRNIYQYREGLECFGIAAYVCTNFIYENMTVHNVSGNAYRYMSDPVLSGIGYDSTYFINCDAYNCADTFIVADVPYNRADGFKIAVSKGAFLYFKGCRAWNCSDDGFDISGSTVAVVENCWAFNMGNSESIDGNGFKTGGIGDSLTLPPRILINTISAFNYGSGYYDVEVKGYYKSNSRYYNNTAYSNVGTGFTNAGAHINPEKPWVLSIWRNNISYKNGSIADIGLYMPYEESNNTWDPTPNHGSPFNINSATVTVTDEDFVSLIPSRLSAPRKDDGSLPDLNGFLQLAKGSDLIDAGTEVDLSFVGIKVKFKGSKPDIGAFESDY